MSDLYARRVEYQGCLGQDASAEERDMASSVFPLADGQYDMVDGALEPSNRDHETASLQPFEHDMSEDEEDLSPAGESVDDIEGPAEDHFINFSSKPNGDMGSLAATLTVEEQRRTEEENDLLDSYLSNSLKTPRQSMLAVEKQADAYTTSRAPSTFETTPSKSCGTLMTKHSLARIVIAGLLIVNEQQRRTQEENDLFDSCLTDSLWTLRQSTRETAQQVEPTRHNRSNCELTTTRRQACSRSSVT